MEYLKPAALVGTLVYSGIGILVMVIAFVVIGVYLASMGLGSYLSKYVSTGLIARFIDIELMIAIGIWPFIAWRRERSFEAQRWSESDYADEVSSGDDDDD